MTVHFYIIIEPTKASTQPNSRSGMSCSPLLLPKAAEVDLGVLTILLVALVPFSLAVVGVDVEDRVPETVPLLWGIDTGPGPVNVLYIDRGKLGPEGAGTTVVIVSVRAGLKKVSVIVVMIPLDGVETENVLPDFVPLNVPKEVPGAGPYVGSEYGLVSGAA